MAAQFSGVIKFPKKIDEEKQGSSILKEAPVEPNGKKFYIESYGCQMNFSDSEIVASVLIDQGYSTTNNFTDADLILVNTCSIRENAEQRVRGRLKQFSAVKKTKSGLLIGVLGCMAERLKKKLLDEEKLVDMVVGPDAYRTLPDLIEETTGGQKAVNVLLSREETYADINPVRLGGNGITAFISIMRGCDNMCSFCVVPFTRGRERSRDARSIVEEARMLAEQGYKEVTLLGQNVDSYKWTHEATSKTVNFANLLELVAQVDANVRVRFSTSHPKDITDEVLYTIAKYKNICNYIHLPVQSGSTRILELMNRGYTKEWYMERIKAIKKIIPDCGISTDIIIGFCTETEKDHQDTLDMLNFVKYDLAYMFKYSERPNTLAERKYEDDVDEEVKSKRLQEIIELHRKHSLESNQKDVGKTFKVLIEGVSKKSKDQLYGRNDQNKAIVFSKGNHEPGEYVQVKVEECTSGTLIGKIVE